MFASLKESALVTGVKPFLFTTKVQRKNFIFWESQAVPNTQRHEKYQKHNLQRQHRTVVTCNFLVKYGLHFVVSDKKKIAVLRGLLFVYIFGVDYVILV